MLLKTVEILGFKSFALKTRVELKHGITGIVGPNGCGKTNVMEAIRWCIGEMSWKSLRSPSMVDVIFNGNAKRDPLSMAEVTLTFDNSSSKLPSPYSEITVTRRIYRNGESEYFLNKTACRLKDIKELFLDTGIGGDGYAIIDQGGVDFVLNSKTEDRRAMFEEAAGVSKYRAKREEAIRKLERVEADLARLQDSIAIITEQIKKLDSDARRAKLYQKYKEELLAQEVGHILKENAAISAELERESALIAPTQEKLGNRRTELGAEEARLAALSLQKTQQEAAAMELNQKMAGLKSEIGRLEERIQNVVSMTEELTRRKAAAQEEIVRDQARLKAMEPEMAHAAAAVEQAEKAKTAAEHEYDSFHRKVAEMERNIQGVAHDIEAFRERVMNAAQATLDASHKLSKDESALGNLVFEVRQTLKEMARKLQMSEAQAAETEGFLAELLKQQELAEAARLVHIDKQQKRDAIKAELAEIGEQSLKARAECAMVQARHEAFAAQGGQDPYWVGAQAVVNAGIPGILGTVRSGLRIEKGSEAFVEDVLGDRLYAVVCQDITAADAAVAHLENLRSGRVRLLVLSTLPGSASSPISTPPQARLFLDSIKWDPAYDSAVRFLLGECYTIDKRLYETHWVHGGAPAGETASLKTADIQGMKETISRLEKEQLELARHKQVLEESLESAEQAANDAVSAFQSETARLTSMQAQYRQKTDQLKFIEDEVGFLNEQAERILKDVADIKEQILGDRKALDELKNQEAMLRDLENESLMKLNAMKAEASAHKSQENVLLSSLKQWETQHQFLLGQQNRLTSEFESLNTAIERRKTELGSIDGRVAELASTSEQSKQSLDQNHVELAACEQSAIGLNQTLQEMTQTAHALEETIRSLRSECGRLQEELHQFELKASALKSKQDSMKSRLWDEWQMTWDEASQKFQQVDVDVEKIATLRRRIQNMGNINMAAPEEYEALTQKNSFMMNQVNDLNQAKDDLRSAISKINATTREHFRQTFTEVREHFRRIYGMLFEGGEADLILTDQENLLETGIEIVAQPPGKRLQSITLLSGGERTLTAIALLFAFFMVRPSPVCMLDEADAALDEANVERFAGMLRQFTDRSQFLIISHNKRTMEAADTIYGVTMEESGLSQIISVDFRRKPAAEKAGEAEAAATPA